MTQIDLHSKNVLIIGGGLSGSAAAKLLLEKGAAVTLVDDKPADSLLSLSAIKDRIKIVLTEKLDIENSRYDLAVISPGIRSDGAIPKSLIKNNVKIVSEIELASWFVNANILAITGTNGKSTTTTLIGEIFKTKYRTFVGGNLGTPFSEASFSDYEWAVLEISSFQLEWIDIFAAKISLILNITSDHLDRHGSMDEYAKIKRRIIMNSNLDDILIYNCNDLHVIKNFSDSKLRKIKFSLTQTDNSDGGFIKNGKGVLMINGNEVELFSLSDLLIKGSHNIENVLASAIASYMAGIDIALIRSAISNFKGLKHRMEEIAVIDGVRFVNDSKATNADATLKSIDSFNKDMILIAGGSFKDADFQELADKIKIKAKAVVLIGSTAKLIASSLGNFEPVKFADSMDDAVYKARELASFSDTILLSPACASFDMFKNYEDRGNKFCEIVTQVAKGNFL